MEVERKRQEKAQALWTQGYEAQMHSDLGNAMRLYQESIQVHPTAEAYTFLGWTYSFLQRYEEAIQECRNAIATDPDFGNPYNDIGSYLIKLGKLDEAIPSLAGTRKCRQALRTTPFSTHELRPYLLGERGSNGSFAGVWHCHGNRTTLAYGPPVICGAVCPAQLEDTPSGRTRSAEKTCRKSGRLDRPLPIALTQNRAWIAQD